MVAAAAVRGPLPSGIDPVPEASVARADGLLLALGGDGTMLRALASGAVHGAPVLGVKLGHDCLLADVEPGELAAALDALARRRFAIEERTMLAVRHGTAAAPAVNDIVLRRAPELARYRGDGVIVATATGSTGVTLAAGGPVVSPQLSATIVTPLAVPGTPIRPIVLSASEPVELRIEPGSAPLRVEIDGREQGTVQPAARLRIAQSGPRCRMVRVERGRPARHVAVA